MVGLIRHNQLPPKHGQIRPKQTIAIQVSATIIKELGAARLIALSNHATLSYEPFTPTRQVVADWSIRQHVLCNTQAIPMRFQDFGFRTKLFTLIGICALGYLAFAVTASIMVSEVQIRSPLYQKIKSMQDLRADILPPPLSLMEPRLLLSQMSAAAKNEQVNPLRKRYAECRREFDARRNYWKQASNLSSDLPQQMYL
ncbi:MAG: hypothetical protein RIS70_4274, partial [Planctomycetota bacterium]